MSRTRPRTDRRGLRPGGADRGAGRRQPDPQQPWHYAAGHLGQPSLAGCAGAALKPGGPAGHCIVVIRPVLTLSVTGPEGAQTLTLDAQVAVNDPNTMTAVFRGGGGIGVLPRFLAQGSLDDGSLEILLPEWRLPPVEISVVHCGTGLAAPGPTCSQPTAGGHAKAKARSCGMTPCDGRIRLVCPPKAGQASSR